MALYDYDLIVIGGGSGGSIAARLAHKAGLSVAIAEIDQAGGSDVSLAEVPLKALLHSAHIFESARGGGRFGIRGGTVGYNYPSMKAWKDLVVKRTGAHLGTATYIKEGINVIHGRAYFIDPHTISIGNARFTAAQFLIATGARSPVPAVPGFEHAGYLTTKEAVNLTRPPKHLAIIGSGSTACEFAQLFATFGTKVHIIASDKSLLPQEEPEVSNVIATRFVKRYGIDVRLKTTIEQVEKIGASRRLTLNNDSKKTPLIVDEILLATDPTAQLDIGLENAGVTYNNRHIFTNRYMQTANTHIYAAGNCATPYALSHLAMHQSKIAAHNILHPKKMVRVSYKAVPRYTLTNPAVAAVGPTARELKENERQYKVATVPLSVLTKANVTDTADGFVKILTHKKTNTLIGGTIVCPQAEEIIHELTLAVQHNLTAADIAGTLHAFPTWSEAIQVACAQIARQ